jgi:ABC-type polar amino acid transport system ATPase subunit
MVDCGEVVVDCVVNVVKKTVVFVVGECGTGFSTLF